MIDKKLKVFCIGSDWFLREMRSQNMDVDKVDWVPMPDLPADVASILKKLEG
jgi:hypothetical protein